VCCQVSCKIINVSCNCYAQTHTARLNQLNIWSTIVFTNRRMLSGPRIKLNIRTCQVSWKIKTAAEIINPRGGGQVAHCPIYVKTHGLTNILTKRHILPGLWIKINMRTHVARAIYVRVFTNKGVRVSRICGVYSQSCNQPIKELLLPLARSRSLYAQLSKYITGTDRRSVRGQTVFALTRLSL
jgi:hypothetical protein